jgi:hypothetical protein
MTDNAKLEEAFTETLAEMRDTLGDLSGSLPTFLALMKKRGFNINVDEPYVPAPVTPKSPFFPGQLYENYGVVGVFGYKAIDPDQAPFD